MSKEVVRVPVISDTIDRVGVPISAAIKAGGFVFVSGMAPIDPRTGKLVGGDIATQTRASLEALKVTLEAAGSSLDKVVRATIYASNAAYYGTINGIYAEYFGHQPPARTFVTVASWPMEFDIEIEVTALA